MKAGRLLRLGKAFFSEGVLISLLFYSMSCTGRPLVDPNCSIEPMPSGGSVQTGQGALQVDGSTSAYFYVYDEDGKQIGYQSLNNLLAMNPGKYQVKVNKSSHPVTIQGGSLTHCWTATLTIAGSTSEYYYVMDSARSQIHYDSLGKSSSFFPLTLWVQVNKSEAPVELKSKQATEIKTGTLIVRGSTSEYYYVSNAEGTQLSYNSLEKSLAFFPGSYTVKVNGTESKADIVAGQFTELETGSIVVKGLTEEYYYVFDSKGKQLSYQGLNKALAFFPGKFQIRVNKSVMEAESIAGDNREYQTGSLIVGGSGSEYYYVSDKAGNQLSYNSLNKPLSFVSGEYSVRFGDSTRTATITAGQMTTVKF